MADPTGALSPQTLCDVVMTLGSGLGGWVLGTMWKEIKDARREHSELLKALPETYARRDDVADAISRIESALDKAVTRIFDKLDQKEDRSTRR